MDKIVARTNYVIKQAKKRNLQRRLKESFFDRKERFRNHNELRLRMNAMYRDAKTAQREDWRLGPLAPRRDVGEREATYGYVDAYLSQGVPFSYHKEDRHIKVGDRVIALTGRDKGKIGKVTKLDKKERTCEVEEVNQAQFPSPEWHQRATGHNEPYVTASMPMPLQDVRLVCKHPETGRDVIVEDLERRPVETESGKVKYRLFIPGCKTPYVREGEEDDRIPFINIRSDDTPDAVVNSVTFTPELKWNPQPESLIDELRGKYSKFRQRHTIGFVLGKERRAAAEERKRDLLARSALTPMQEYHLMMKQRREALPPPELTEEMWARIARVMAAPQAEKAKVVRSMIADGAERSAEARTES